MSVIDRVIHAAQRRLWLNRWLAQFGWLALSAAGLWSLCVVVERTFAFGLPLQWIGLALGLTALLGAMAWWLRTREASSHAAAVLDSAAGLKERISSCHWCRGQDDPFAKAVIEDAVGQASRISVRSFVPLRWPRSLSYGGAAILAALLALWFLPTFDILGKAQAREIKQQKVAVAQKIQAAIAKPVEALQELAQANPAMGDIADLHDLEKLAKQQDPIDPNDLRREAIKKLDRVTNDLRSQAANDRYESLREMKERLSEMGQPMDPRSPIGQLAQALSEGDFKSALEQAKKAQEQLARRKKGESGDVDPQKLSQQLDDLAKKLNEAAGDKKLQEKLEKAGLSPEDVKRALDALNKKDSKQLEKMAKDLEKKLKENGATQQQIDKLKQQLQQAQQQKSAQQQAQQACKNMSQAMQKAGQKAAAGDSQGAAEELGEAGEQLSQMESIEQELGELESKLSNLDQLKDDLSDWDENQNSDQNPDGSCQACNGSGFNRDGSPCQGCDGTGQGNGQRPGNGMGSGRGSGQRPFAKTDVDFVKQRAKVKQRKGTIIGQWFVNGEQIRGEAKAEFEEAADAAVRDAADALQKDQVPRAYQGAVKAYFDRLGEVKSSPPPAQSDESTP